MLVDRARRPGDVPLPAHVRRHRHPERRRPALARRDVRRDVSARLQPEQPDADGADDLDRLRRGRRDRDDREHLALHRGGGQAARGRAQGLRADRLHDRVADRLAHRGPDPAALHGRHRRPALPRVRRDAERHDPGLGRRLADADADDVRQAASPQGALRADPLLPRLRARLPEGHRLLRPDADRGAAPPDGHARRRRRDPGRRPCSSSSSSRRASSRCRTRA